MTNHEKDRHVLAAAVRCGAETIVTYNLKDFPRAALAPYSITAQGPSTFLKNLYELDRDAVVGALKQQSAAINNRWIICWTGFALMFRRLLTRSSNEGEGRRKW